MSFSGGIKRLWPSRKNYQIEENKLSTKFIDKLIFLTMAKIKFLASYYFSISKYQYLLVKRIIYQYGIKNYEKRLSYLWPHF